MNRVCNILVESRLRDHGSTGKSGVFHVSQNETPIGRAEGADSATAQTGGCMVLPFRSQMRTPEKASVRMEIVEMLSVLWSGVSNPDVGAVINESPEMVRQIREGAKPLTADHLLRIARRRPEWWAVIERRMRGGQ